MGLTVGGEAVGVGCATLAGEVIRVDQVDDRVVAAVESGDPLAAVLAVGLQQEKPGVEKTGVVGLVE